MESSADNAKKELREYLEYEAGWDGYDGKIFDPEVIELACEQIDEMISVYGGEITQIIPGPASDGSVDVEFRMGKETLFAVVGYGDVKWILSVEK